jgi:hypothetical protein
MLIAAARKQGAFNGAAALTDTATINRQFRTDDGN